MGSEKYWLVLFINIYSKIIFKLTTTEAPFTKRLVTHDQTDQLVSEIGRRDSVGDSNRYIIMKFFGPKRDIMDLAVRRSLKEDLIDPYNDKRN